MCEVCSAGKVKFKRGGSGQDAQVRGTARRGAQRANNKSADITPYIYSVINMIHNAQSACDDMVHIINIYMWPHYKFKCGG
jgi:hypothetical protein